MCILPATISNNVPGTDHSLGADTSLNAIVEVRPKNRNTTNGLEKIMRRQYINDNKHINVSIVTDVYNRGAAESEIMSFGIFLQKKT